jgi:hypothetical protein
MDDAVTHTGHLLPWHFRVRGSKFRRHLLRRFAQHLQVPDDGVLNLVASQEGFFAGSRVLENPLNCLPNVEQVGRIILYKGTASASTLSRM